MASRPHWPLVPNLGVHGWGGGQRNSPDPPHPLSLLSRIWVKDTDQKGPLSGGKSSSGNLADRIAPPIARGKERLADGGGIGSSPPFVQPDVLCWCFLLFAPVPGRLSVSAVLFGSCGGEASSTIATSTGSGGLLKYSARGGGEEDTFSCFGSPHFSAAFFFGS